MQIATIIWQYYYGTGSTSMVVINGNNNLEEARMSIKLFGSYDRSQSSKNCRKSPFSIEVWIFDAEGEIITQQNEKSLAEIINCIYLWNIIDWSKALETCTSRSNILRTKSDFFCS